MSERVWTAAELEKLSPDERRDVVRAGFQKDLTKVSPDLIARAQRKAADHIRATEGP